MSSTAVTAAATGAVITAEMQGWDDRPRQGMSSPRLWDQNVDPLQVRSCSTQTGPGRIRTHPTRRTQLSLQTGRKRQDSIDQRVDDRPTDRLSSHGLGDRLRVRTSGRLSDRFEDLVQWPLPCSVTNEGLHARSPDAAAARLVGGRKHCPRCIADV